jgi:transposase
MYSRSAPRRRHGAEFKAKVLAACDEPGASISAVALAHGLNANLVRQWRAGRGVKLASLVDVQRAAVKPSTPAREVAPMSSTGPEFVAIGLPVAPKAIAAPARELAAAEVAPEAVIHVELRRGPLHLNIRWPRSAAKDCTAWLRELTADLLK